MEATVSLYFILRGLGNFFFFIASKILLQFRRNKVDVFLFFRFLISKPSIRQITVIKNLHYLVVCLFGEVPKESCEYEKVFEWQMFN